MLLSRASRERRITAIVIATEIFIERGKELCVCVIMATLSQVYTNLAVGTVVTTLCFIGFGIAVRSESNKNLTPRAWARPIVVIKNCLTPPYSLTWIYWAMSLRYIDLLAGIPGTGTRMKGWSGPTLRTNLDGIVLLRYHVLQFKVRNAMQYNAMLCYAMQ